MADTYGYNIPGNSGWSSTKAENAQNYGFGAAKKLLGQQANQTYQLPSSYTSQLQGPAQMQTASYQAAPTYQTTATPTYQGLMGGDYQAVYDSLSQPINQQHQQAMAGINSAFGASGLYGSDGNNFMSGAMSRQNEATQNALANAKVQQLGLMAQDLAGQNQFNAALFPEQIRQNAAQYAAGLNEADRLMSYDQSVLNNQYYNQQAGADFANSALREGYGLADADLQRRLQLNQMPFTNALALAGQAAPVATSANQTNAYTNAANQQAQTANTAGWLGLGGTLAGSAVGSDWFGDALSSLWG